MPSLTAAGTRGPSNQDGMTRQGGPQSPLRGGRNRLDVVGRAVRPGEDQILERAYLPWMGSGKKGAAHQAWRGVGPDPVILEFRFRPEESDEEPRTGGVAQGDLTTRADLARSLNASIYKAGLSLTDQADEEFELAFFCACGCMVEVRRSLQEYVRRGAILDGHPRPASLSPPPHLTNE